MFQAGKNVLLALYAVSTIYCLLQPREAYAASQTTGQSEAVISKEPSTDLNTLIPSLKSVKVASYKDTDTFVYSLRKDPNSVITHDKSLYASPESDTIQNEKKPSTAVSDQKIEVAYITPVQAVASATTVTPDTSAYALNADVVFDLVNKYRASIGIPTVQKDDRVMEVAKERAPEIFDEVFVNGNMHAGFYARHVPYHSSEIIIYYNTEEGAVQWWLNSPVHRGIISDSTYTHAGIACSGKSCSMIFASFDK